MMDSVWSYRVLGEIAVVDGQLVVQIVASRQRRLLAALIMRVGRPVSMRTLVDAVWGDRPPRSAVPTVQSYVSRLRTALGPDSITLSAGGYTLNAERSAVDAGRFEELIGQARSAPVSGVALDLLDRALALWNGEPYQDLADHGPGAAEAARLAELRVIGYEERAEALIALGRSADAVADLRSLTIEQPLRENCWRLLMVALHASGRQAEALRAFHRYDELMAVEGLEPSAVVRRAHAEILAAPPPGAGQGGHRQPAPDGSPPRRTGARPHARGADAGVGRGIDGDAAVVASPDGLVGRDRELAALDRAWRQALDGSGTSVFLVGESGIGKSRLAAETAARAGAAGMRVLRGRGSTIGRRVPLRPIAEAVGAVFRDARDPVEREAGGMLSAFATLLAHPDAVDRGEAQPLPVVAEAVLRFMAAVSQPAGCVLLLDDLNDADPETMALIEYLVDNLAGQRTLLVAVVRLEPCTALDLAYSASRRRAADLIELAGLDIDGVARLAAERLGMAASDLPADLGERLHRDSGGNPFYVEELLATADRGAGPAPGTPAWRTYRSADIDLPCRIVTGVLERSRQLGPTGHGFLVAAAVLGHRFPLPVAQQVAGIADAEVGPLVRAAVESHLLAPDPNGRVWYVFRHALTASCLVAELTPARHAELARRAADVIQTIEPGLPGEWCQLAAALRLRAGDRAGAGRLLVEAGRRALAGGASQSATALFEEAATLLTDDADLRNDALESMLYALADAGEFPRAIELAQRLDRACDTVLDYRRRAALFAQLGWLAVVRGQWNDGLRYVQAARALLPPDADEGLVAQVDAVAAHLTLELPGHDRTATAEQMARRAAEAAERADLPVAACQSWLLLGVLTRSRSVRESTGYFTRALGIAEKHRLATWRLQAMIRLGGTEALNTGATGRLDQVRWDAERIGALTVAHRVEAVLVLMDVLGGRYARAAERIDAALPSVTRMGMVETAQYLLLSRALVSAHRGDRSGMERALVQFGVRGGNDSQYASLSYGLCRAVCALLEDDRGTALAELDRAYEVESANPTMFHLSGRHGLELLLAVLDGRAGWAEYRAVRSHASAALRWNRQFVLLSRAVLVGRAGNAAAATAAAEAATAAGAVFPTAQHLGHWLVATSASADGWGEPSRWLAVAERHFAGEGAVAAAAACRRLAPPTVPPVVSLRRWVGQASVAG
jgi:DNA-binding SARP family transcriptional activator